MKTSRMIRYYADVKKYYIKTKRIIHETIEDINADQLVHVKSSVWGTIVRPGKRWSPLCEKLFQKFEANGVWLEDISCAPNGTVDFINSLSGCERLVVEGGQKLDLGPLSGNSNLLDLQVYPAVKVSKFDFGSMPSLRRCMVPLIPQAESVLKCQKLISLSLCGGQCEGSLNLDSLSSLEEFFCESVRKINRVVFNPNIRLRSLRLRFLRDFKTLEPLSAVLKNLRVVELEKIPLMEINWLVNAKELECISLRVGEIPSIKFLGGLKKLEVLDLIGTKVKDNDLSLRDSLKGELNSKLWSDKD
jgi:hypothetical protein